MSIVIAPITGRKSVFLSTEADCWSSTGRSQCCRKPPQQLLQETAHVRLWRLLLDSLGGSRYLLHLLATPDRSTVSHEPGIGCLGHHCPRIANKLGPVSVGELLGIARFLSCMYSIISTYAFLITFFVWT